MGKWFTFPITRKFFLGLLALIGTFVLAMKGSMSGAEWLAGVGLVLGIHNASNITDKKLNGPQAAVNTAAGTPTTVG